AADAEEANEISDRATTRPGGPMTFATLRHLNQLIGLPPRIYIGRRASSPDHRVLNTNSGSVHNAAIAASRAVLRPGAANASLSAVAAAAASSQQRAAAKGSAYISTCYGIVHGVVRRAGSAQAGR